ncbi:MAG: glycoside hydrolase family 2 protein [Isosphaeraceae bacterium]
MIRAFLVYLGLVALVSGPAANADSPAIPRPEHPRPDAMRTRWANLNGSWQFRFDPRDEGQNAGWEKPGASGFDRTIIVPFPWESELSGIHQPRGAPRVGWYRRTFRVPAEFPKDEHVWLRFGAVDWRADVWVNGKKVGDHEGGYTPFEFDVTGLIARDGENTLVVRAFDPTDPGLPTGKQVHWYTPSSGIWQTVWIESRPAVHIARFRMIPSIDPARVAIDVEVAGAAKGGSLTLLAEAKPAEGGARFQGQQTIQAGDGAVRIELTLDVPDPKLWSPESPTIYSTTLELRDDRTKIIDHVETYFGLRTIAKGQYGDEPFERILLNGKPLYLRAALDQSFNPQGIYTAPDDAFMKHDMELARSMGLNALRIHIKPDEPRRLYWADLAGILILEDMPNTWRQDARARLAWEHTMREAVARDLNHPAIVAWVAFNETWGLGRPADYKKDRDTQHWVSDMVQAIRTIDPTRLVEDNSPCNYDHIVNTDLNSWHFYIDDHDRARQHIQDVVDRTKPGSAFNYCPGLEQASLPLINSEYGAVSAGGGDRDISWGLRDLTTQLRRHRKIQGFVYTELTDIEWEHNGLANYDRTPKVFGYDSWLPDMHPNELLGADFVGYDTPPAIVGAPGDEVTVPVFVSHYSDRPFPPKLRWWVTGYDDRADIMMVVQPKSVPITWKPYDVVTVEPIKFRLPTYPFVGALILTLRDPDNHRFASNFVNIVVKPKQPPARVQRRGLNDLLIRFTPGDFARQSWTEVARAPAGKVYGHGKGFFEYRIEIPRSVAKSHPETIYYLFEASSKAKRERVDWPERVNRQDYPQTDAARQWPSTLGVSFNDRVIERVPLVDDPADARGVLSHLARVEHGSHGELVDGQITLTDADRARIEAGEPMILRLAVPADAKAAGGLCIYGADTGELPLDPTLSIHTRDPLPDDLGVGRDIPAARRAGP